MRKHSFFIFLIQIFKLKIESFSVFFRCSRSIKATTKHNYHPVLYIYFQNIVIYAKHIYYSFNFNFFSLLKTIFIDKTFLQTHLMSFFNLTSNSASDGFNKSFFIFTSLPFYNCNYTYILQ